MEGLPWVNPKCPDGMWGYLGASQYPHGMWGVIFGSSHRLRKLVKGIGNQLMSGANGNVAGKGSFIQQGLNFGV